MSDTFQPGEPRLGDPERAGDPGGSVQGESATDALAIFSEDAFQEYEEQPLVPLRRREAAPPAASDVAMASGGGSLFGSGFAVRAGEQADAAPGAAGIAAATGATAAATGRRSAGTVPTADVGPLSAPAPAAVAGWRGSRSESSGVPDHQKALLWTAGGIVALLALLALFLLGTRLGAPAPVAAPQPIVTETPALIETAESEPAAGSLAPGVHDWRELRGGECLEPYTNPWAEQFTVVDCALPHRGQVLVRAIFPGADENTAFPTAAALQAQISVLCSDPTVIDLMVAGGYSDIQVDGSYAVTAEQWDDGLRDYTCFVSRTSGQPITESFVVSG